MKTFLGYMLAFLLILGIISGAIWYFVLQKRPLDFKVDESGRIVFNEPSVLTPDAFEYVDQGIVSGGKMQKDLAITQIRFGIHPRFERLVLQTRSLSSSAPIRRPGYFELLKDEKDPTSLKLRLYGYSRIEAPLPPLSKSDLLEKISVEDASQISIKLKKPVLFKAYTLTNPARIVIDFEPVS